MADKVRENKIRRMATRQGMSVQKSRRRDPRAIDYGGWMLCDDSTSGVVVGGGAFAYSATLDDIEDWLTSDN